MAVKRYHSNKKNITIKDCYNKKAKEASEQKKNHDACLF